jgi:hypothetical protein
MLSVPTMTRNVQAKHFRLLLDRVMGNGRRFPAAAAALARPDRIEVAAVGLALQRALELTYAVDSTAWELARRLIAKQREDGAFGSGSVVETSVAARALAELLARLERPQEVELARRASLALQGGLHWLAGELDDVMDSIDGIDATVVFWQVSDCVICREALPVQRLREVVCGSPAAEEAGELHHLVRLLAA